MMTGGRSLISILRTMARSLRFLSSAVKALTAGGASRVRSGTNAFGRPFSISSSWSVAIFGSLSSPGTYSSMGACLLMAGEQVLLKVYAESTVESKVQHNRDDGETYIFSALGWRIDSCGPASHRPTLPHGGLHSTVIEFQGHPTRDQGDRRRPALKGIRRTPSGVLAAVVL